MKVFKPNVLHQKQHVVICFSSYFFSKEKKDLKTSQISLSMLEVNEVSSRTTLKSNQLGLLDF